jgi:hypothetical protein
MSEPQKPVKFRAEIMWSCHNKVNEMSGKYQMELTNLSQNAVDAIKSLGLEVRKRDDKPEKGFFITAKSNNPIKVFDAKGEDLSNVAIGNGSKAVVVLSSYDWSWKNKKGRSASLKKVVVEELQSYDGGEAEDDGDDDVL